MPELTKDRCLAEELADETGKNGLWPYRLVANAPVPKRRVVPYARAVLSIGLLRCRAAVNAAPKSNPPASPSTRLTRRDNGRVKNSVESRRRTRSAKTDRSCVGNGRATVDGISRRARCCPCPETSPARAAIIATDCRYATYVNNDALLYVVTDNRYCAFLRMGGGEKTGVNGRLLTPLHRGNRPPGEVAAYVLTACPFISPRRYQIFYYHSVGHVHRGRNDIRNNINSSLHYHRAGEQS